MKFVVYLLLYMVYPLSFVVPRSDRKWAFGSFRGAFNDNAKYLFLHAQAHAEGVRAVWLSMNRETVRAVRAMGLPAYHVASVRGVWHALTSRYWFFNAYTSDILYALSGRAVCINLWHGVGLKRTEFNVQSGKLAERYQQRKFKEVYYHPEAFRRPDWLLTSTPFQTVMFAEAFRIPASRCLELGYPRNGILTCGEAERTAHVQAYEGADTQSLVATLRSGKYRRVYIYMPSWRDSQREVFTQSFDMPRLNALLAERGELMLLKPHANVIIDEQGFKTYSNISIVGRRCDIYPALPYTDVLITDYSSILYDYLLMPDKGVILYLYDYAEYVKDRDLYYPFDENVVGTRAYSFDELYRCIEAHADGIDGAERQAIVDRFWGDTVRINASEALCSRALTGAFKKIPS